MQDSDAFSVAIARHAATDGLHETEWPKLALYRISQVQTPIYPVYEPTLCLVAQGAKEAVIGNRALVYDRARYLVTSVHVPVESRVIEASPEHPFLALLLRLDANLLRELACAAETGRHPPPATQPASALAVGQASAELVDAGTRLVRLLDTPTDLAMLAPLVEREILYRLLCGELGPQLVQFATTDHRLAQVTRAVAVLCEHFREPIQVAELAARVGLSPSALHRHFKAVTGESPLQYQKALRLREARRLMLADTLDAASAAYAVGYESPSQFSREYRRQFGAPPARDLALLRAGHNGIAG